MTDSATIVVELDGTKYRLRAREITAIDSKAFRDKVGIGLMEVFTGQASVELEVAAGLLWIARRKSDPRLTYEDVAGSLTFDSDLRVVESPDSEMDDSPET
jgi:hypothetical protein